MSAPVVLILAAGEGTRMRSATPKLLHPLCGRPMIAWPVSAARDAGAGRIVVVDGPARRLEGAVEPEVMFAVQEQPLGTADAVKAAAPQIAPDSTVIVLCGDVPLVTPETIRALADAHTRSGAAATMATMTLADPAGYGRVVRGADGAVERVVETKAPGDATAAELEIREVNTGIYAFAGGPLLDALAAVRGHNVQGELYLPDVLPILRARGLGVGAHEIADAGETVGVNDRVGLAAVRALAQRRIHERHMLAGVTIVDPACTVIDVDVELAPDAVVAPFTSLHGATRVAREATIGPHSTLIDARVGEAAAVVHSYLTGAEVGPRVTVGPFAYLRPGTILREGAKAGTFVEIKNSDVGAGAKVPHLSYIGDTSIGERTNIGAGTITANYDGSNKHRTEIGAGAFVSVDTALVAPVSLGDGAYTGAGSVITDDVPPGALAVARARQRNVPGYADRRKQRDQSRRAQPAVDENMPPAPDAKPPAPDAEPPAPDAERPAPDAEPPAPDAEPSPSASQP
ncbi:MAG: bifunctional UDP-N-acetylglucosamine diphosphorylase/glucosamine-1-phosphate N-acetyltransferase GlmU [Solirubrobacterales bacterium]|nr:bifunctional UDP-N-acetylglucosamine diphosphorylase/glucosamine-1-phosphate N-acetyltransferase GlmU [Solirubrobacterales bacterium]